MWKNPLEVHAVPSFPIIGIVRSPLRLPKALSRVARGSHLVAAETPAFSVRIEFSVTTGAVRRECEAHPMWGSPLSCVELTGGSAHSPVVAPVDLAETATPPKPPELGV